MDRGEFTVDPEKCTNIGYMINRAASRVETGKGNVEKVKMQLARTRFYDEILTGLQNSAETLGSRNDKLLEMGQKLQKIAAYYKRTEMKLVTDAATVTTPRTEDYEIQSEVFDSSGAYGGDQGRPQSIRGFWSEKKDLYDIVRKYYPDMKDREIKKYLKKLNSEGCGYVAVVNTIFAAYEGREQEFEQTFGFPMYYNGDLNYNKLIVDFYTSTDNHNITDAGDDVLDEWEDYTGKDGKKSKYHYYSDKTGRGSSQYDREYRTKMYLQEKGVPVKINTDVDVTLNNAEGLMENGYIVIAYRNGNLHREDGSVAGQIDGGHAMVITGVTADGRYIVSSWGGKYYIDPNETIDINGNKTSMTFSYFQYE